jgi:hypothetical protein
VEMRNDRVRHGLVGMWVQGAGTIAARGANS